MERQQRLDDDLATLAKAEAIAVSSVTVAELLSGAELSRARALRQRAQLMTEELLRHVPTLPFDLEAARIYARLNAQLRTAGVPVGGFDLQIASIAVAHGCSVVTLNLREFTRIPGLVVIAPDW